MKTKELSSHPLVRHHLTLLRDRHTDTVGFRRSCTAVSRILIGEAARALELESRSVETPLEAVEGSCLKDGALLVPILRAGLGMVDAALETIPGSVVGHIGLERDEATAQARFYYRKVPTCAAARTVIVLDPMLATGGSAVHAIDAVKDCGGKEIVMASIIAAPEGVEVVRRAHPDVGIVVGVIDRELDANKYIRPGLGDFGDRLFGTQGAD